MNETLNEMDDSGVPVRDVSFIPAKTETTLRAAGLLFLVIGVAALAVAAGLLIRLVLRLAAPYGESLSFYIIPVLGAGFFGGIFTFFGRMMYKPYSDIDKARRRLRSGSGVRLINGTVRSYEDDMSSTINGSGHYQILSIRIIEDGQPVILRCGTMDLVRHYAIDETVTLRTDGTVYEIV